MSSQNNPSDTNITMTSDDRLIKLARDGHWEAMGELYRRYRRRAFGYALQLTIDRELAEDLVQEAFIDSVKAISKIKSEDHFRNRLFKVISMRYREHRMKAIVPTLELAEISEMQVESEGLVWQLELEDALAKLSLEARESFLLVVSQRLTYEEAAEILNSSPTTVRRNVTRAFERLRQLIAVEHKKLESDEKT